MKAIVQERYGSPDVLELRDIGTPVAKDDEVLPPLMLTAWRTAKL